MGTPYETDIVAWANEQAALLRAGKFSELDAFNLAEEIEDVGKSEQHELASRLAVLVAHLLKWHFQPGIRTNSWRNTINEQRRKIERKLRKTPSLKHMLEDPVWLEDVWVDAVCVARSETKLRFPARWIWSLPQVLDPSFFPD